MQHRTSWSFNQLGEMELLKISDCFPSLVLLIALSAAGSERTAPTQNGSSVLPERTQAPPAQEPIVVPLEELVRQALENNLTLRSGIVGDQITAEGVRAAQSIFNPFLFATTDYGQRNQTVLLPEEQGGPTSGTQGLGVTNAGVTGTLPSSTQYDLSFSTDRLSQSNPFLLQPGTGTPSVNSTLTLRLAQPLLRGRGPSIAQAPIEQASLAADASYERLLRLIEQTIAQVELGYWTLGLAEEIEELSQDSYDRSVELLGRNQRMQQLELISQVDVITSQQGEASRLTALTDARRQRQDAAQRLIFLVFGSRAAEELSARDLRIVTEPRDGEVPPLPPVEEIEAQALDTRHDVSAAELDLQGAEVVERVAGNSLLPELNVIGSLAAQTRGTDQIRFFTTSRIGDLEDRGWRAGLEFSYPLGNDFARATHQRALLDLQQRELFLATIENGVRSEVRDAVRGVLTGVERLSQAQLSLQFAQRQYEAAQQQLQLDLIDSFRVLQVEEEVTLAQLTLAQVRFELLQALTLYELAIGTIDEGYQPPVTR
jgi:outer membrane protein